MIADLNHVGVIPVDLFLVEVIPYSWQNGVDPSPEAGFLKTYRDVSTKCPG